MIGLRVPSRFAIEQHLGSGGFGVVYAVFDHARQERVALKQLHRVAGRALDRFKREFRELSQLTHPNLPLLYELFHHDGQWFFTMELLDGVSLWRYVTGDDHRTTASRSVTAMLPGGGNDDLTLVAAPTPSRPLSHRYDERRLRHALDQLTDVVGFLHGRGYVHGDLKPSNVLVGSDERLYLLDFGLLGRQDERRTDLAGTMTYAAPELLTDGAVERHHDTYALGTMFFELCSGRLPFEGEGRHLLLEKARRPAPSLASVVPDVPNDLGHLIDGWLATDPAERPPLRAGVDRAGSCFVGRSDELQFLVAALERVAASGRSEVVVLEGMSGFGKTALAEAFVQRAARSALTIVSRASAREHVPFNAFDGVLDALAPLPRIGRSELATAIKERLVAVAAGRPTVLWIDDMQWADQDSIGVLEELVQPPRLRSCLLLLTKRPHEPGYTELRLPCPIAQLSLGRLSDEESQTMVRALGIVPENVEGVVARGAGVALFLEALCATEHREYGDAPTLLRAEVARLSAIDRALVDALALSQSPLPASQLTALLAGSAEHVGRALERLCRQRLLRPAQRHETLVYAPFHDQVREVVLELMPAEEARRYHERLLAVLPDDDPRLFPARFEHLRGAGRRAEAAALAVKAASAAEAMAAFEQAAFHLEQGLALGSHVGEARTQLLGRLIDDLERAKLGTRAAERALELARTAALPSQRSAALIRAVRHFFASGDVDRGRVLLTQTLAESGERWPRSDLETVVRILAERHFPRPPRVSEEEMRRQYELVSNVADGLMLIDPSRSILFVARAISRAKLAQRKDWLSLQLLRETLYVGSLGSVGRFSAWFNIAAARRLARYSPAHVAWERFAIANMELHSNPRASTAAALGEAGRLFGDLPDADGLWVGNVGLVQGTCFRVIGDLPGVREQAAWLSKLAERRKDSAMRTTTLLGGHIIWLADDAPEVSRYFLRTIPWPTRRDAFHFQHWLRAEAEVETSLYEGDAEGGWNRIAEARRALLLGTLKAIQTVRMSCNFTYARALLGLIEAQAARGTRVRRRDRWAISAIAGWLDLEGSDAARVRADLLRAGVGAVCGDEEEARRALRRARTRSEAADYPLYRALTAYALGALGDRQAYEQGDAALRSLGVVRPERFVSVELPGMRRYFSPAEPRVEAPATTRSVPSSTKR